MIEADLHAIENIEKAVAYEFAKPQSAQVEIVDSVKTLNDYLKVEGIKLNYTKEQYPASRVGKRKNNRVWKLEVVPYEDDFIHQKLPDLHFKKSLYNLIIMTRKFGSDNSFFHVGAGVVATLRKPIISGKELSLGEKVGFYSSGHVIKAGISMKDIIWNNSSFVIDVEGTFSYIRVPTEDGEAHLPNFEMYGKLFVLI